MHVSILPTSVQIVKESLLMSAKYYHQISGPYFSQRFRGKVVGIKFSRPPSKYSDKSITKRLFVIFSLHIFHKSCDSLLLFLTRILTLKVQTAFSYLLRLMFIFKNPLHVLVCNIKNPRAHAQSDCKEQTMLQNIF